jgi:hypothetical protein
MLYRITLRKDAVSDARRAELAYEAVVYIDYEEEVSTGNQPVLARKAFSVAQVYTKATEELRDQSAFRVIKIEEIPSD